MSLESTQFTTSLCSPYSQPEILEVSVIHHKIDNPKIQDGSPMIIILS